jgi:hypothetical protein
MSGLDPYSQIIPGLRHVAPSTGPDVGQGWMKSAVLSGGDGWGIGDEGGSDGLVEDDLSAGSE